MGASSSVLQAQNLQEFQKLDPGSTADLELPVPPQNRKLTDKKGFIIFGILMVILLPFLIYTLVKSDIRRLDHGSDSCGNLCGVDNKKISGIDCSGKNFKNQPFEIFIDIRTGERGCTSDCPPGYHVDDNVCYDSNTKVETRDLFTESFGFWWKFVIVILITTVLCISTLFLIRYFPGVVVWGVSILGVLSLIAVTALFWVLFAKADVSDPDRGVFVSVALILTVFTVIIVILFLIFRKNIQLIVLLYKETAKALFAMPLMMFVPILTLALQFIIFCLMLFTLWHMQTGANLVKNEDNNFYSYRRNDVMVFAMVFNAIVTVWALEFFTGFQYMVLAGSVAQWFFKKTPISPIAVSFTNSVKYHLGTLAFGSFIITLVAVIKALIKSLISNSKLRWLVDCCCGNIEALLKFLSKNAYIETAIYGQSFFRSGRRAASLLVQNAASVLALNSVGDFVLGMLQIVLLVISTAIAYGIFLNYEDPWFPTSLSFIGNLIIVVVVFGVFETIVDTLLVCFCEDTALNDGTTRPYNMSTGYMQFVEETKKVYKK